MNVYQSRNTVCARLTCQLLLLFLSAVAPPPDVTAFSEAVDVNYQDNITIFCLVTSVENVTVTWSTPAGIVPPPEVMTVFIGDDQYNSSLMLTNVGPQVIGTYTCTAMSSAGKGSDTITVTVIGLCVCVCVCW